MKKPPIKKASWGGKRPNSGRPKKDIERVKLRVPKFVHQSIQDHLKYLKSKSGKYVSAQDYCSECLENLNQDSETWLHSIAKLIAPGSPPWAQITLTEKGYNHLVRVAEKISPLTPVYTSFGGTFTAIILKEMSAKKKSLESTKPSSK